MSCRHSKPWCWAKITMNGKDLTQDSIKNMHYEFLCPKCKIPITNEDVTDSIQLVDLISIIRASGSKQNNIFEGIR